MAMLKIIDPGLMTTVQDFGRPGFQSLGVPVSGAVDRDVLVLANMLVGNSANTGALELRYMGVTVEAVGGAVLLALAGTAAPATLTLPGGAQEPVPGWRSVLLPEGARLKLGGFPDSATAYLAVKGGFDIAPVMESASTYAASGVGGHEGRALVAGDLLDVLGEAGDAVPHGFDRVPDLRTDRAIRVVLGPQADAFTADAVTRFLGAEWSVTKDADRMGLRLDGPALAHADGFNIISDGITSGSVQVPGTGRPIILLVDRQTTGGYPKIATVISADLAALGRKRPGDRIRFEAVSAAEAVAIRRDHEAWLVHLAGGIGPVRADGSIDLDALYSEELITALVDVHDH
ncbi:MAG: biotin-dependent carboxyltransferase family protein [Alphaproteobacteria bacterium]|nr:biotin-dependent carboxyltransferase family protein [Alphaproteobacteria bacterium]